MGCGRDLPSPINCFSATQKVLMRVCIYGFTGVGVLGVFLEDPAMGAVNLAIVAVSALVALFCFCAHCPYPYAHNTCLIMPHAIFTRFIKRRPNALSLLEKALFVAAMVALIGFPQYWLFQRMPLFVLYWALCLPTCIAFPFHFCRRCRFTTCPFNPREPAST